MKFTTRSWYCTNHIQCNTDNYAKCSSREIEYIIIHYTGNTKDTATANANYFANNTGIEASAHVFVDENTIIQSIPFVDRAWHCGGTYYYHADCRNYNSIGIEMCCSGNYTVSEKTKSNTIKFVAELFNKFGWTASDVDERLLRHYDITHKKCPAQMSGSNNAEWIAFKKALKDTLEEEGDERVIIYKTVNDVLKDSNLYWAKEALEFAVEYKIIADPNNLNLSEEGLRLFVYNYRMHIL